MDSRAAPVPAGLVEGGADTIHLAPVLGEVTDDVFEAARAASPFVGVTPQGLLRHLHDGRIELADPGEVRWPSLVDAIVINAASPVKDAALEFVTYMYKPDNYRRMVEGCEDVIFAQPSAARQEYLDALEWLKPGYDGVSYVTPFDVVGDFVFNFNEFGQIVITNFADVLTTGKSVEEAMAVAQTQAEELAERIE